MTVFRRLGRLARNGVAMLHWRSRVLSGLLAASGAGLALASLGADLLTGTRIEIGWKQRLALVIALGVLGLGLLLWRCRAKSAAAVRWLAASYLVIVSLAIYVVEPTAATWILLACAAAMCIMLPRHFGIATFGALLALHLLLGWVSAVKIDLTGLPLTVLDIQIAAANPAGLWDALALPQWTRYVAVAFVVAVIASWVLSGLAAAARSLARGLKRRARHEAAGRIAALACLAVLMAAYLENLYATVAEERLAWDPEGVVQLLDRLGVLPFVGYSYRIESIAPGDIYRDDDEVVPPSREDVRAAVLQYVHFPPDRGPLGDRPNIAVVLAESTFDPRDAFRLHGEWNGELFEAGRYTAALGPLIVNGVGGGTWIAEFETIVGLDSRLFGYSGTYTHASVAPFIERSFATYLREKGYHTFAFFPVEGGFYNMRRAYDRYGFQTVRDSIELGSREQWMSSDPRMVELVTTAMGPEPQQPFFAYVLLIENHSPHECDAADGGSFKAELDGAAGFARNCALNEYLRRLDSTTSAVGSLVQYLEDVEARTGRPFVVLVFGDHQPFSFTSTGGFFLDYAAFRNMPDKRRTFFHVLSSAAAELDCCSDPPSAAILPTLLSGFVASGPDDVYLGETLWLFSQCPDAVGRAFIQWEDTLNLQTADTRSAACESAYRRALAAYRSAGIVRLASPRPTAVTAQ